MSTTSPSQRRQSPIGVFDSGVGGLTVVRQLHRRLPGEDILYLGDTARVPYGTKSASTIQRFAAEDAAFLLGRGVKALVIACNTASALAIESLRKQSPVPVFGVIEPGARAAVAVSPGQRIGVIATSSTIRSGAYERAIRQASARAEVFGKACPLLVPLVEEGWLSHVVTDAVLREYLSPLTGRRIDTLVLGCTHYPLLKPAVRKLCGKEITLVDSAESCAVEVSRALAEMGLLAVRRRRAGVIRPFVTDEPDRFSALSRRFLPGACERPQHIELPA